MYDAVTEAVLVPLRATDVDLSHMRVEEVRRLWLKARAEVWRREGRKLDKAGYPVARDRRQDRDELVVEATSDSMHPEGF